MSLDNTSKRGFPNLKDSNSSVQLSHKNIEFQDPQAITFSKNMSSSNSQRKITSKPSIDLSASSSSLALENFVSYANPASNHSKNLTKVKRSSRGFDNNKLILDDNIEESHKTEVLSQENGNPYDGGIRNKVSQSVQLSGRKAIPTHESHAKVGIWGSIKIHQSHALADPEPEAKSHTQHQKEFSLQNSKVGDPDKNAETHEQSPEKENQQKLDFTLGVFTPQKNPSRGGQDILNSISRKNTATKSDSNIPRSINQVLLTEGPQQEKENKPTPRKSSRLQAPQNGYRVQTEVENTPHYDEMEAMAKTFKPIHSRNRDVQGLKSQNSTRNSNDSYQSVKHQEHPQKLNRLEEEILNLKNENLRQNEVIEILIDFVKQQKVNPPPSANKNLYLGGRQMNYSSNPKVFNDSDNLPLGPVSNFVEPKFYQQNQSTAKKQNPNFYKHSLIEQNLETSKKSQRPLTLGDDTPNFAPRQEGSFSNVYLSPARPLSKLPKVHDPTGTQRVYSSPMASFIEKSQAFPTIMGPRVTKSGNAENNTRSIIDLHKKNFSSFKPLEPTSEINIYEPSHLKLNSKSINDLKTREEGLVKRASESDLKRKQMHHGGGSLPLLTTLGKGISENAKDSLDSFSIEQMKYANDLKKHIRREPDFVEPTGESHSLPQLPDAKAKGKILKEVFSLNWKKKSCV